MAFFLSWKSLLCTRSHFTLQGTQMISTSQEQGILHCDWEMWHIIMANHFVLSISLDARYIAAIQYANPSFPNHCYLQHSLSNHLSALHTEWTEAYFKAQHKIFLNAQDWINSCDCLAQISKCLPKGSVKGGGFWQKQLVVNGGLECKYTLINSAWINSPEKRTKPHKFELKSGSWLDFSAHEPFKGLSPQIWKKTIWSLYDWKKLLFHAGSIF